MTSRADWLSIGAVGDLASAVNVLSGYINATASQEDQLVAGAASRLMSAAIGLLIPLSDTEHAFSAHYRKAPVTSDSRQRRLSYAETARNQIGDAVAHLDLAERAAEVVFSGGDVYCTCYQAHDITCPDCGLPRAYGGQWIRREP
jgi:hypothetical protein